MHQCDTKRLTRASSRRTPQYIIEEEEDMVENGMFGRSPGYGTTVPKHNHIYHNTYAPGINIGLQTLPGYENFPPYSSSTAGKYYYDVQVNPITTMQKDAISSFYPEQTDIAGSGFYGDSNIRSDFHATGNTDHGSSDSQGHAFLEIQGYVYNTNVHGSQARPEELLGAEGTFLPTMKISNENSEPWSPLPILGQVPTRFSFRSAPNTSGPPGYFQDKHYQCPSYALRYDDEDVVKHQHEPLSNTGHLRQPRSLLSPLLGQNQASNSYISSSVPQTPENRLSTYSVPARQLCEIYPDQGTSAWNQSSDHSLLIPEATSSHVEFGKYRYQDPSAIGFVKPPGCSFGGFQDASPPLDMHNKQYEFNSPGFDAMSHTTHDSAHSGFLENSSDNLNQWLKRPMSAKAYQKLFEQESSASSISGPLEQPFAGSDVSGNLLQVLGPDMQPVKQSRRVRRLSVGGKQHANAVRQIGGACDNCKRSKRRCTHVLDSDKYSKEGGHAAYPA